jgi:hypothetical protein
LDSQFHSEPSRLGRFHGMANYGGVPRLALAVQVRGYPEYAGVFRWLVAFTASRLSARTTGVGFSSACDPTGSRTVVPGWFLARQATVGNIQNADTQIRAMGLDFSPRCSLFSRSFDFAEVSWPIHGFYPIRYCGLGGSRDRNSSAQRVVGESAAFSRPNASSVPSRITGNLGVRFSCLGRLGRL